MIRETHATLIIGGSASDRAKEAKLLASQLLCSSDGTRPCGHCSNCRKISAGIHPDLTYVYGENQIIRVDDVRAMRSNAFILPNEAKQRIFIIENADNMNEAAQNAILKILEEPPPTAAFILTAVSASGIRPTVLSRCSQFRLGAAEEPPVSETAQRLVDTLASRNRLRLALFCRELEKLDRDSFSDLLESATRILLNNIRIKLDKKGKNEPIRLTKKQITDAAFALMRIRSYVELNCGAGILAGLVNAYCWEAIH